MIWSVSTSLRSSGTARAMISCTASINAPPASVEILRGREPARDRGRRGHRGGDEVRAAPLALAPLAVAIRRRRAPLAGRQLVGVHGEAHRAARFVAPSEAGLDENLIETPGLRRRL